MLTAVVAVLALLVLAARIAYPRWLERRAAGRRRRDAQGFVIGARAIVLARPQAPAVLLLHGAGDTPQVLAELAGYLHGRGYAVHVPLLSGHGRELKALRRVTAMAWFNDAVTAYNELRITHAWVGIVGLSMGAALAIRLAALFNDLQALVLLAPYVGMPPVLRVLGMTADLWAWALPYVPSFGGASIRDPEAASRALGYGLFTPQALRALRETSGGARRALAAVRAPTLMVQSRQDNRLSVASGQRTFDRLGAEKKRLVWTTGAGHVLTVDRGREQVFALTDEWLLTCGAVPTAARSDPLDWH